MRWWRVYGDEAALNFKGERWTCAAQLKGAINWIEAIPAPGLSLSPQRIHAGLNSGYQAIGLAYLWGAARIVLLGYDMQRGPRGESHHHGDHEGGLPNLGSLADWARRMVQLGADLRARGVEVVNASRRTAITCFERQPIDRALAPGKAPLVMIGMHGIGDNLHERGVVRELMKKHELWLQTSWPQFFHDMPELHLLPRKSPLRAMARNEISARALYGSIQPPNGARTVACGYLSRMPKSGKSVLQVMSEVCGAPAVGDFRLPIPAAWNARADAVLAKLAPSKPLLIYRPPIQISEANKLASQAKVARNPDLAAYHALITAIRADYFVISIADLKDKEEWLVGPRFEADAEFHRSELDFETIAAITARAALVYTSPCFLLVLAQAVSAPLIAVFGGFEDQRSFAAGARFSPWLPIEPRRPCCCWSHACVHDKSIDVPAALAQIQKFRAEICKH